MGYGVEVRVNRGTQTNSIFTLSYKGESRPFQLPLALRLAYQLHDIAGPVLTAKTLRKLGGPLTIQGQRSIVTSTTMFGGDKVTFNVSRPPSRDRVFGG